VSQTKIHVDMLFGETNKTPHDFLDKLRQVLHGENTTYNTSVDFYNTVFVWPQLLVKQKNEPEADNMVFLLYMWTKKPRRLNFKRRNDNTHQ